MIALDDQWVLLERDGWRCLFNRWDLSKRYFRPGEEVPRPADLPRADMPSELPRPVMNVFQVVVTESCDLACAYCGVRLSREEGSDPRVMSRDSVGAVIRRMRSAMEDPSSACFAVTGGEPLTSWEVTRDLLEAASGCGARLLFTNATLLDEGIARTLAGLGVSLIVSVDGSRDTHDRLRVFPDGSGSWDRMAEGVARARDAGIGFGVSLVVREHNSGDLAAELESIADSLEPASFGVNLLHYTQRGFCPPDPVAYAEGLVDVFHLAVRRGLFVDQIARRLDPLVRESFRYRDCSAMGSKLVVFPDLTESNCVNQPPPEAMSDQWWKASPLVMEGCSACPAIGICGGGCPWDGTHLSLYGDTVDERYCIWILRLLEEMLWDMGHRSGLARPGPEDLAGICADLISRPGSPLTSSIGHSGGSGSR